MISAYLARASAATLAMFGLALLFGADAILPALIPGFPASGAWVGQLLAAAWIGVATLTWNGRSGVLGGIYGRPVVATNATMFLISAISLLRAVTTGEAPAVLWVATLPCTVFAGLYFWLMMRGPFARDLPRSQA